MTANERAATPPTIERRMSEALFGAVASMGDEEPLEERILTILDICAGNTRPLTDAEKVRHIDIAARCALEQLRAYEEVNDVRL